jgi:hypothetical protein
MDDTIGMRYAAVDRLRNLQVLTEFTKYLLHKPVTIAFQTLVYNFSIIRLEEQ